MGRTSRSSAIFAAACKAYESNCESVHKKTCKKYNVGETDLDPLDDHHDVVRLQKELLAFEAHSNHITPFKVVRSEAALRVLHRVLMQQISRVWTFVRGNSTRFNLSLVLRFPRTYARGVHSCRRHARGP